MKNLEYLSDEARRQFYKERWERRRWRGRAARKFKRLCEYYGNTCVACGQDSEAQPLTRDHIIPKSKGGSNRLSNIQPLCQRCNKQKGTEFTDYRPWPLPSWWRP